MIMLIQGYEEKFLNMSKFLTLSDYSLVNEITKAKITALQSKMFYFLGKCKKLSATMVQSGVRSSACKNQEGFHVKKCSAYIFLWEILGSVYWSKGNKSKNKQMGLKLKSFCITKETINKMKTEWEKIFANDMT